MIKSCEKCAFWEYFDSADDDESAYEDDGIGTCKRSPPVFIGFQREMHNYPTPKNWAQPITAGKNSCGEFSLARSPRSVENLRVTPPPKKP